MSAISSDNWLKIRHIGLLAILTAVIVLFTFPPASPDYGPGLDTSYMWGLNWLFVHDYAQLTQLTYPFGPLAFLRIPSYEGVNFAIYLVFFLLLKVGFVVTGFLAAEVTMDKKNQILESDSFNGWFVPSILLMAASYFVNTDSLIIFNCLFLSVIAIRERALWPIVLASILAIVSLFIKISIGINALSVVLVALALGYAENRDARSLLIQLGGIVLIGLVFSFAILNNVKTITHWYKGAFHLVFGYGSLSLNYANHPLLMWLHVLSVLALIIVCKSKSAKYICIMMVLPMFAFWKYGVIREDEPHYFAMVCFVVAFWLVITLLETQSRKWVLLLSVVSILSLVMNASKMPGYKRMVSKEFCGVNNFVTPYFHYQKMVDDARNYTEWLLQANTLPDTMLGIIGQSTIDIYPYEFTYAAQNKLNWQPRAALGTALSPWLEAESAKNFDQGDDAAQFVLMHFQDDGVGGNSTTLDNHYFLNDEPKLMRNVLNHFRMVSVTDRLMLLAHTDQPLLSDTKVGRSFDVGWQNWIDVPSHPDSAIVRVRVGSKKSLFGAIKALFFKDVEYYVEYQTSDGNVYRYRYNPAFASEGLWCSPFVRKPCDSQPEPDVVRVRFLVSEPRCVQSKLRIAFDMTPVASGQTPFVFKSDTASQR